MLLACQLQADVQVSLAPQEWVLEDFVALWPFDCPYFAFVVSRRNLQCLALIRLIARLRLLPTVLALQHPCHPLHQPDHRKRHYLHLTMKTLLNVKCVHEEIQTRKWRVNFAGAHLVLLHLAMLVDTTSQASFETW